MLIFFEDDSHVLILCVYFFYFADTHDDEIYISLLPFTPFLYLLVRFLGTADSARF